MEQNNNRKPVIGITHGDINGIGYEVLFKAFAEANITELFTPIIYGSAEAEAFWRNYLAVETAPWRKITTSGEAKEGEINLISCTTQNIQVEVGVPTPLAGKCAFDALERAMEDALNNRIDALVTAPINKATMPQDLFPFKGHTDYLGAKCGLKENESPLMILTSGDIRVALATTHVAISEVAGLLSESLLLEKLQAIESSMQRDFDIEKPRIAVLSLNPHSGDRGLMGREEIEIITPTLQKAREQYKLLAFGPFAADGFWGSTELYKYDAILALYHDQGLAPFKSLFMNEGVNFTAGLPIIRTSPDHGTGYDIAGKNLASSASLTAAIYLAIDTIRRRNRYNYARRNPLRKGYNERGNDNEILAPTPQSEE